VRRYFLAIIRKITEKNKRKSDMLAYPKIGTASDIHASAAVIGPPAKAKVSPIR
jgi:hypothetical protein